MINYKTFKYAGKFDKSISVFTGPGGQNKTVIRLVGNVEPIPMGVIRMEPRKAEVGTLNVNRGNEVQVILENTGDALLTVSRIVSAGTNSVYFDAKDAGELLIPPGEKRTVKLIVIPGQPGRFLETILIYSDARNDIGKGYKALLAGEAK